jgi:hypothetical protein
MVDVATIAILVGSSGALVSVAKGIWQWVRGQSRATVVVGEAGTVVHVKDLSSKDAAKILEMLTQQLRHDNEEAKSGTTAQQTGADPQVP